MGDSTEELLPLLSYPTTTTIVDAIDDLATHIVATFVMFNDSATVETVFEYAAGKLWDVVNQQLGNDP